MTALNASPPVALRVSPAAERALRQGHPWLYESAIVQQSREGEAGDLAVIFDRKGRFLAVGLYDPHQAIRVRILQQGTPATIDEAWFQARLKAAAALRASLPAAGTDGYRVVHGENDGLPGLVIDRYGETAVFKIYTTAWLPYLDGLCHALSPIAGCQRALLRLSRRLVPSEPTDEGLADGAVLFGPPLQEPLRFRENGLVFEADPQRGQKTGFYLDQRENRARVEKLALGQEVLNVFAYTGGFSVYAARGGASLVISVDSSEPALAAAKRNFAHNRSFPAVAAVHHECLLMDAFQALARLAADGRRFGMVVLDPPAFAHNQEQRSRALGAYRRLTSLSLGVLRPGGVLVQASCSRPIAAPAFFAAIHEAARSLGRPLRELERTEHPLDHPVRFAQAAYLKCLFAIA